MEIIITDAAIECDCSDADRMTQPIIDGDDLQGSLCASCERLHKIRAANTWIARSKALSPDWILSQSGNFHLTNIDDGMYAVYCTGEINRLDYAIATLRHDAFRENARMGPYTPESTGRMLLISDNTPVGYLIWGDGCEEYLNLGQVYIRPEHRREGYATEIIEVWWKNNETAAKGYLVSDPTESVMAILSDIDHIGGGDDDIALPAFQYRRNTAVAQT